MRYCFIVFCFLSCTSLRKQGSAAGINRLHYIGAYDLPYDLKFQNTTVGGLSGIDYDPKSRQYYLICDDRSAINPARFYTATIDLNEKGIQQVQLTNVTTLKRADGSVYPNSKQDPSGAPDPEAIRYNPVKKEFVWSSEGERIIRRDSVVLQDPAIIDISLEGAFKDAFSLPPAFHMQAENKGPRQNSVFEGLSFTDNYRSLLVSMEEPIYEDGPRAGTGDSSAWIRILRFDVDTRKPTGQFGYRIDPVVHPASPPSAFKINGISDLLALNNHQVLVVERSFSTGIKPCTIRVYLAEMDRAGDVSGLPSLLHADFQPVQKKLLLNMDDLGIYIDNIEGVCPGPRLPDGRQTLVFVADNNFSADELTQFLLFAIE